MSRMTIKQALAVIQSEVYWHAGSDTHYRAERLEPALATLRAEIKRLHEQLRLATVDQATAEAEASDAHAENERLRAEIERLRAEDEGRAITAVQVTLFGWACYLPAGIAEAVEQACAAQQQGQAVATVSGEFSEVRQDGEVYWLQTVLLKRPQQLPFGAPLYTAPPPSAVPEGLTARDRCVLRLALHRFMGEAYARHNEASQKTTRRQGFPGAAEHFYRDAKDAERLLSVFAAAPEQGEVEGG